MGSLSLLFFFLYFCVPTQQILSFEFSSFRPTVCVAGCASILVAEFCLCVDVGCVCVDVCLCVCVPTIVLPLLLPLSFFSLCWTTGFFHYYRHCPDRATGFLFFHYCST